MFFSIVNIYMLLHIYILYSSWLCPGLPCTLCLLTSFHFPLFSLVKLFQVMLLQLRTEHSLDEIQHWYAEKHEVLLLEHQKSTWIINREALQMPCLCATGFYTRAVGSLAEQPAAYCSEMAEGGRTMCSSPNKTNKQKIQNNKKTHKTKFGDAVGYSLKIASISSVWCSLISLLFKWLMIVKILPRAKYTVVSLNYSVFFFFK